MHSNCTIVRRKLVKHSTLNPFTGEFKEKGQSWVTEPCNTPMFSDDERQAGECKSCASGWTHPNNFRVNVGNMVDEVIEVDGTAWHVRFAESREAALGEIAHARVTGSVGGSTTINGQQRSDVVRLNTDGSECQPS